MVAKINRTEQLYKVVAYNHHKVDAGTARIIGSHRMIDLAGGSAERQMQRTLLSFENHLLLNRNTEKPILHISLNPTLDDRLTETQYAALAHDYMCRMGYGDQPYIVYLHEDIGRRHLHIVSTCVDDAGRKLNDKYEWRRSMKACRDLERKYGLRSLDGQRQEPADTCLRKAEYSRGDAKHQIGSILKSLYRSYRYQSFGEWSALLLLHNIEARKVRGEFRGEPYTGVVYTITDDAGRPLGTPVKASAIGRDFGYEGLKRRMLYNAKAYRAGKWRPKIRKAVAAAILRSRGDRQELRRLLDERHIGVQFRENEAGRIYGVTFIDREAREVYNGSRMGKAFSANVFERLLHEQTSTQQQSVRTEPTQGRADVSDIAEAVEQAFGIFSFEAPDSEEDHDEEAFAMRMRRQQQKKRRRTRGIR
ncbi:conjugal transfer protein MobB [uncultured Alistipes sp.]|uniref:conjugal transfer protein MobB n=1 Tax=uncultured Alistipes sp. TaxID=538949 RepID=UPI0026312530|nr:conjugal transfer protein MobB [uncultured Alistipes sp.]